MDVIEIIRLAATYLQLEEVLELSEIGGTVEEKSELAEKNLNLLLECVNLIYSELASDYLPLKEEEEITVENNEFLFSNLSKAIHHVLSLRNAREESVYYSIYPSGIKTQDGTYLLEYSYHPEAVTLEDDLESFAGRLSERIVAYGVASEFSFISGLFDEAATWKTRFTESLKVACSKKSIIQIPPRRWM